jgi:hypothetical protein
MTEEESPWKFYGNVALWFAWTVLQGMLAVGLFVTSEWVAPPASGQHVDRFGLGFFTAEALSLLMGIGALNAVTLVVLRGTAQRLAAANVWLMVWWMLLRNDQNVPIWQGPGHGVMNGYVAAATLLIPFVVSFGIGKTVRVKRPG